MAGPFLGFLLIKSLRCFNFTLFTVGGSGTTQKLVQSWLASGPHAGFNLVCIWAPAWPLQIVSFCYLLFLGACMTCARKASFGVPISTPVPDFYESTVCPHAYAWVLYPSQSLLKVVNTSWPFSNSSV